MNDLTLPLERLVCPILHGDVSHLARILLTYQPHLRADAADHFVQRAMIAYRHVQETGKLHHSFGNGSIMSTVRNFANDAKNNRPLPPEPTFDNLDYIDCFSTALAALVYVVPGEVREAAE